MQTKQEMFLDMLGTPDVQYVIPVFQRVYSWDTRQCRELWTDINRAGRLHSSHFVGTLLYAPEPDDGSGTRQLDVIDGQQRTSTLTLLLAALEKHLREKDLNVMGIDSHHISKRYLHTGEEHKLVLSRTDRDTLFALIDGTEMPEDASERVVANYQFFCDMMNEEDFVVEDLVAGLQQLVLIVAELLEDDRPQLVFESLNSKGMPLTTADLIRNYLLIAEDRSEQTRLYNEYWKDIEEMFGEDPESTKLNNSLRAWLTIRCTSAHIKDKSETYNVFKAYVEEEYQGTPDELLEEIRDFCLVWRENYEFHEAKFFRSDNDWAKGKRKTLAPGGKKTPPKMKNGKPAPNAQDLLLGRDFGFF